MPIVVATSKNIDRSCRPSKRPCSPTNCSDVKIGPALRVGRPSWPCGHDDGTGSSAPRSARRSRRASRKRARSSAPISRSRPGDVHGAAGRQWRRQVDALARHFRSRRARRAASILYRGAPLDVRNPREALDCRHRHGHAGNEPRAATCRSLENIFLPELGRPGRLSRTTMRRRASEILADLGQEQSSAARTPRCASSPRRSASSSRSPRRSRSTPISSSSTSRRPP